MEHGIFLGKQILIVFLISRYRYTLKIQVIPTILSLINERERNVEK